jgi:hypothetical protein
MLERAWDRWRSAHGLAAEPLPPVSSYVGYSIEEPWGRPRVVFGVDAADAEKLAALLLERAASSSVAGQPAPEGENLRAGQPQPGRAPQALDKVRARIPVQGRTAELNGGSEQRSEPDSEQRAESASQQSGTGASEQRGDRVREQRGEPASEERGDGDREQRSEPASQQGADGVREQGSEPASGQRGDGTGEQGGDRVGEQPEEPAEVTGPINGFDPVQANAHPEDQIHRNQVPGSSRDTHDPAVSGSTAHDHRGHDSADRGSPDRGSPDRRSPNRRGADPVARERRSELAGLSEPPLSEPPLSKSGLSKSGLSKAGLSKSGVSKSGVSKSGVSKSGVSKPEVSKPGVSKRGAPEPGRPEPGRPEPGRGGVGVSSAPGASDEGPAMAAGPDGLAAPDDSVHDEQAPSAHAGSQHPGDSAVPRTRADSDAGDRRDASRGVADTMAAELAGWAAGELPGQASARLAAWATVGGSTSRGGLDADLRTSGGAAE